MGFAFIEKILLDLLVVQQLPEKLCTTSGIMVRMEQIGVRLKQIGMTWKTYK